MPNESKYEEPFDNFVKANRDGDASIVSINGWIYPIQPTRFSNNVGYWTKEEILAVDAKELQDVDKGNLDFGNYRILNYYNRTILGPVTAYEGPSPSSYVHAANFIRDLKRNGITAHIGAGNPLSGVFQVQKNGSIARSSRGFFDITYIPENYYENFKPEYLDPKFSDEYLQGQKQKFRNELRNNSEIQNLLPFLKGSPEQKSAAIDKALDAIVDDHFAILAALTKDGIKIEVEKTGKKGIGATISHIKITDTKNAVNDQEHHLNYLALSSWDDFTGARFSLPQYQQIANFYADNQEKKFGVNCTAGLGRSGVVTLAFNILQNGHDKYFDERGVPQFDKIEELLFSLRAKRPGLIQTGDQFTLAIGLAHALHLSRNKDFVMTNELLEKIANNIETHFALRLGLLEPLSAEAPLVQERRHRLPPNAERPGSKQIALKTQLSKALSVGEWGHVFDQGWKEKYEKKQTHMLFFTNKKAVKSNAIAELGRILHANPNITEKELLQPIILAIADSLKRGKGSDVAKNLKLLVRGWAIDKEVEVTIQDITEAVGRVSIQRSDDSLKKTLSKFLDVPPPTSSPRPSFGSKRESQ